jgi:hypothetical protein
VPTWASAFFLFLSVSVAQADVVFSDLFNRPDSNTVDDHWIECENDIDDVGILSNTMRIRDQNGCSFGDAAATRAIPTIGYENIQIAFNYCTLNTEISDTVTLKVSYDGSVFSTYPPLNLGGTGCTNYTTSLLPSAANDNANFVVRIQINVDQEDEGVLIDDLVVSGTPSVASEYIYFDDFNRGPTNNLSFDWTECENDSDDVAINSGNAMQLRDQNGCSFGDAAATRAISTVGYEGIQILFYYCPFNTESSDTFTPKVSYDGSVFATYPSEPLGGTECIFYVTSVLPSQANNNPNFAVRLQINVDQEDEGVLIDDFAVAGAPTSAPTDTTPPSISSVRVEPSSPVYGQDISLKATATDTESNIASAEYTGNGITWNNMSADDGAFNGPSENVTYTRPGNQPAGQPRQFCVRATDTAGNTSDGFDCVNYTVTAAQLTVTFDGEEFDLDGRPTSLKATVSGGPSSCYSGKTLTFNVQSDEAGGPYAGAGKDILATVGSDGKASIQENLPLGYVYEVEASFPNQNLGGSTAHECLGDSDTGITVVADPNASSTGGGWYKVDGLTPPRVNFGYTARSKYSKRTEEWTTTGNVLWMHQNNYRLKGTILNGGNLPDEYCEGQGDFLACAAFEGEGTLYERNELYDPCCNPYDYCGMEWVNPMPVTFLFVAHDGGSSKECKGKGNKCKDVPKPDEFGMEIDITSIDAETGPIELHGGNLMVR